MLPSTGYFKGINCPFYESGLCERPYCHFRHAKKEISESNNDSFENGEILQQLVSEAVKKVLQHTDSSSSDKDGAVHSQSLITKVVQELTPATSNKSVSSTTKVTYNPTPISELNKLMPAADEFQPAPSRKEYLNRKHIPVPYTPHRPSRSHTARATTKSETTRDQDIKSFNSRHAELDKYTPVAMECESSVKYLPGSLVEHKPTPYSPISTDPNHQQSAYTPTDIANISEMNVSCYTPSGQSVSGVTYSPGAAVSADYSTSSYCPNNTSYSANSIGSRSPCYTSSLSYQPTPLCKTITPKFSSDEDDEPSIKKARVTGSKADFQGLEDLDSEFEMLGEILDDENECTKKSPKALVKSGKNEDSVYKPDSSTLDIVDKVSPAPISISSKMSKNHSKSSSSSSKVDLKGHSKSEHKFDASKGHSKSEFKSDIASSSKIHPKSEIKSDISASKSHSKSELKSDTSSAKGHSKSEAKSDMSSSSKGHPKNEIKSDTSSSRGHSKSDKNEVKTDTVSSSRGRSKGEHKSDSAKDRKTSKSTNCEDYVKRESEKTSSKKESSSEKHQSKKRDEGRTAKDNDKDRHSASDKSKSHKSTTSRSESKSRESKSDHHHKSKTSSNSSSSSKSKNHISKSSSSDKKSSGKDYKSKEVSKHDSNVEGHKKSSKERQERRHKEKEKSKLDKSSRRSKENPTIEISKAPPDDSLSDTELIEEFSDSDEEKITEECLRIFEEYVPSAKEIVVNPHHSSAENVPKTVMCQITGKKRVAHNTNQTIYRTPSTVLPDHKAKAIQLAADRFSKVKQFHDSRMKRISTENPQMQFQPPREEPSVSAVTSSSKVRIAHVPNVSTLLHAKKALRVPEPPKCTVVQTVTKGASRVAHMPNDTFCERPGVLEPLASKIAVNIRSRYLNLMIDECLKIYLNPEDAYDRAQHEELSTNKKCTAIPIYKNSAVLTISRLRKEVQEAGGVKISNSTNVGQSSISHSKVLLGKLADNSSWSIENKYKKENELSNELKGEKFYENISKWILTEEELRENGFPRPHPEKKDKGLAKIFTVNTRQKPQKGNIRLCCRCKKEYTVDKKGMATIKEDCIYHPNNKYRFRGEVKYQCCGQDVTSDGCLSASCHVYEYVDHDNLRGFVKTLPLDRQSGDQQDYRVYALDCEMCYTSNGLDLTRVTVIDNTLTVVYESLVKPLYPIIDYNTRYSGLTEEHLRDVTTTLLEVQATFLHMFSDKTILVGHSLESDFKALKLIHDTVVDTSVLFPHKMGPPYKRALRNLSSEYLKKIIQNSLDGHDSAEDATVCMELLIWKLKEELKTR